MTDQDEYAVAAKAAVTAQPGCPDGLVSPDRQLASAARPAGLRLVFDGPAFSIRLSAEDGTDLLSLGPYAEIDVVAIWRSLAASSGLPLLVAGADGALHSPYPQLGRLVLGGRPDRRRLRVLNGRRPRFLTRRKPGTPSRRPLVYRGCEIAGWLAD